MQTASSNILRDMPQGNEREFHAKAPEKGLSGKKKSIADSRAASFDLMLYVVASCQLSRRDGTNGAGRE